MTLPLGLSNGVDDGVGYVLGLQDLQLQETTQAPTGVFVRDVVGQFRGHRAWLHDRDADVGRKEFLAQSLGDGAYGVLGPRVDPAGVAGHLAPAGDPGRLLGQLLGGANEDLVDAHPVRLRHRVDDRFRDILSL